MLTTTEIQSKFRLDATKDSTPIADIDRVQKSGHQHGLDATYKSADFGEHNADWMLDAGYEIERIEDMLGTRQGRLLTVYRAAFSEGTKARAEAAKKKPASTPTKKVAAKKARPS